MKKTGGERMDTMEKLKILTDAAKYDVACTSSGAEKGAPTEGMGSAAACGICHSFAADGRCISLLKVLYSNACRYNCAYCMNRAGNDVPRATFTPRELADLTIQFYRRNYIEGLFLSSGIVQSPDYTCERLLEVLRLLREEYQFRGYIHVKAIPGADPRLLQQLGLLADRMSVNIELPSEQSLRTLAPDKDKTAILRPMELIRDGITENRTDLTRYRHAPHFVPGGQSTQMIVGATAETDYTILRLTQALYQKYALKRVYFSAYVPVADNPLLPAVNTPPPLLREHRLYQADWLLRYYGFQAEELLDPAHPNLHTAIDPKCSWAVQHMEHFPVDVQTAPREMLLRVPGIGPRSVKRILYTRRAARLDFEALRRIGVVLRRAQYFILCSGRPMPGLRTDPESVLRALISDEQQKNYDVPYRQTTLWDTADTAKEPTLCLT